MNNNLQTALICYERNFKSGKKYTKYLLKNEEVFSGLDVR
jgi:hypothetical protein